MKKKRLNPLSVIEEEKELKKEKRANRNHCDYCRRDISCTVYISCAECPDFNLCLECFAAGAEFFSHKNNHKYHVVEYVTQEIFEEDWGADEEIALLDAILTFGFGNWQKISDYLGSKSKSKCESHYETVYLQSSTRPLPDMDISIIPRKKNESYIIEDKEEDKTEDKATVTEKPLVGLGNMVGYQPHRGDFECEYENSAEQLIADMEFMAYDTPQEKQLKLAVLDIYNRKLRERIKRKNFILERGLLFPKENKKRTKEEKEIFQNFKLISQFMSPNEYEQLIQDLLLEQQYRRQIDKLQKWRMLGITTFDEGEQYEIELKKREVDLRRQSLNTEDKDIYIYSLPHSNKEHNTPSRRTSSATSELSSLQLDSSPNSLSNTSDPSKPNEIKETDPWDLESFDKVDLLSNKEKKLCNHLRLLPNQYLLMKDSILSQVASQTTPKNQNQTNKPHYNLNLKLLHVDIRKSNQVFDFMVKVGWIPDQYKPQSIPSI